VYQVYFALRNLVNMSKVVQRPELKLVKSCETIKSCYCTFRNKLLTVVEQHVIACVQYAFRYLFKNEIVHKKYRNKNLKIQYYKNTSTSIQYNNTVIQVCLSVAKNNTIEFNSWHDSVKPSEKSKLKISSRTLIISDKNCTVCQSQLSTSLWCLCNKEPLLKSMLPHTKTSNVQPKCEQQSSVFLPSIESQRPTITSNSATERSLQVLSQTLGMRWQKMLKVCEYRQWKVTCPSTAGEDNYEYQLEFSKRV